MARMNGNTDSGIESDPECETTVLLVVDIGSSVITSRDNNVCNHSQAVAVDSGQQWPQPVVQPIPPQPEVSEPLQEPEVVAEAMEVSETELKSETEILSFDLIRTSGESLAIGFETYSEYETQCLPEFFDGSVRGKCPQSYLAIRNHFLRHWTCVRPKRFGYHEMLRKVGHLHLGNVTAFSRIQKFLEAHKAINASGLKRSDMDRIQRIQRQNRPKVAKPKRTYSDNQMKKLAIGSSVEGIPAEANRSQSRTRPNPFKLVPLEAYESEAQAPFAVRLSMEALAIIDIHAHCVRTEVIGLLGGVYTPSTKELFILTAEPCASLDDHDLQCDMEPVSQAIAKERLEQKSYHVVGWYHSHPTFVPNPSLRDLETQGVLQQYFSKESSQPFVALILSPYLNCADAGSDRNSALVSKFKCLWLSDQMNAQNDYKIPYELRAQIIRREKLMFSVENKLQDLCSKIRSHASKVHIKDKVKRFRGMEINHLDKLCHSLRHYLSATGLSAVECDYMLDKCKDILLTTLDTTLAADPTATEPVRTLDSGGGAEAEAKAEPKV